ncbi:MAG: hypothetical protein ACYTFT_08305 [Planctomycetota bacterium]
MRETPAQFKTRTQLTYAPRDGWAESKTPLRPDEPCPTLFRYPGPFGVMDRALGTMRWLGPAEDPWLWLADAPARAEAGGAKLFGVIAVLQPLRFSPARTHTEGHYIGENALLDPATDHEHCVWIPPEVCDAALDWDALALGAEVREAFGGAAFDAATARVQGELAGYLEELDALQRARAQPLTQAWCDVTDSERRSILETHGIPGRWTART